MSTASPADEPPGALEVAPDARRAAWQASIAALRHAAAAVRPRADLPVEAYADHVNGGLLALCEDPARRQPLRAAVQFILATPDQQMFFAEAGLRSAKGFALELAARIGRTLLPLPPDGQLHGDAVRSVFDRKDLHWLGLVTDDTWARLLGAMAPDPQVDACRPMRDSLAEAARWLSYRLAGCALDRELLRADADLERHESPFLALNALVLPWLERLRADGTRLSRDEWRDAEVLLEQCEAALARVRRRLREIGVSIRLTYLIARMDQLVARLRAVLGALADPTSSTAATALLRETISSELRRDDVGRYVGETVSLLARNVTDHAARHGEHYIARERHEWLAMARAAAGGGVVIAFMALIKLQLAQLHLPPLTEGIAFGLNYGLGFVLIHMLGCVVATKQPAMTASAIASTLEEAKGKRVARMDRLADLCQDTVRTQFVAVLGNVGVALPLACLIALAWPPLLGSPIAADAKLHKMLAEVHPLASGALFFAAVAGVGLFLSGLASGYFDNQARYLGLGERVTRSTRFGWLGPQRASRLGHYIDEHYGAILGNLFFGLYLGLAGAVGSLTGLPIDVRHVAFSSANLGTALVGLGWNETRSLLLWAIAGIVGIAVINLVVSFALALYVAVRSRQLGFGQLRPLAATLLARFVRNPLSFFRSP